MAQQYTDWISVEEYLEGESRSEIKHEYQGGAVIAMAGASRKHELVALNLATTIHGHLRGQKCRAFKSDMKLRVGVLDTQMFFYPDIMVACEPEDDDPIYVRKPKLIIEILSEFAARDRVEKYLIYQRIPSLEEYVMVNQHPEQAEVIIHRREDNWEPAEIVRHGNFTLRSIGLTLTVEELYVA